MAFNKNDYKKEFNKQNYDNFSIRIPKGKREELKKYADEHNMSLNSFVKKALTEYTDIQF